MDWGQQETHSHLWADKLVTLLQFVHSELCYEAVPTVATVFT